MTKFETIRGTSRLLELGYANYVECVYRLESSPIVTSPNSTVSRSLTGQVETQPEIAGSKARIQIPDIGAEEAERFRILARRTLIPMGEVEVDSDPGRGILIPGDSATDTRSNFDPLSGSTYDLEPFGGRYQLGAVAVSPANPPYFSRTNLLENGDMLDTTAGALDGWTNNDPSRLSVTQSLYFRGTGRDSAWMRLSSLGAGTKSVQHVFDTDGIAANALPSEGLTVSFKIRSDKTPLQSISNLVTVQITISGGSTYTVWQGTPSHYPQIVQAFVDMSAESASSTSGHTIKITASNDLKQGSVYVTDVQIEGRRFRTAHAPYSTSRELDGSRSCDVLRYLNTPAYRAQIPAWIGADRFGITYCLDFNPFWSTYIPGFAISSANNKLDFQRPLGGTIYAATITPGQYDSYGLALEIQKQIVAQDSGNNFTVTYNASTDKFTIAGSVAFNLRWQTGANAGSSIGSTIGFDTSSDDTGSATYTSDTADAGAVSLIRDGDLSNTGNVPGIRIVATEAGVTAIAVLADGSSISVTETLNWTLNGANLIVVSYQDWDGSTADSGTLKISLNQGADWEETTHSGYLARLGSILWLGTNQDGTLSAAGSFNSVIIDPVFIDDDTYTLDDFFSTTEPPSSFRTAIRAVLDPAQKLDGDFPGTMRDNAYNLDLALIESKP